MVVETHLDPLVRRFLWKWRTVALLELPLVKLFCFTRHHGRPPIAVGSSQGLASAWTFVMQEMMTCSPSSPVQLMGLGLLGRVGSWAGERVGFQRFLPYCWDRSQARAHVQAQVNTTKTRIHTYTCLHPCEGSLLARARLGLFLCLCAHAYVCECVCLCVCACVRRGVPGSLKYSSRAQTANNSSQPASMLSCFFEEDPVVLPAGSCKEAGYTPTMLRPGGYRISRFKLPVVAETTSATFFIDAVAVLKFIHS